MGRSPKCVLCGRSGYWAIWYDPDTCDTYEVQLCRYHHGAYMAFGIIRLNELMLKRIRRNKRG